MNKKKNISKLIPVKVLFLCILFLLIGVITVFIVLEKSFFAQPSLVKNNSLYNALSGFTYYLTILIIILLLMKIYKINRKSIFGEIKYSVNKITKILYVIPLIILSLGIVILTYIYFSIVFPEFLKWLLSFNTAPMIWTSGKFFILANIINFITMVIIGPFVEEFLFRGLIMTRWSEKWNITAGIILSSACFGILHGVSLISATILGIILSIVYIQTRSLFIPVIIHMLNNFLVWIVFLFLTISGTENTNPEITEMQNYWQVGVACLLIGILWLVWFFKNNRLPHNTVLPYFSR